MSEKQSAKRCLHDYMLLLHMWWVAVTRGAKIVGKDQFGNKYYEAKPRPEYKNTRRWVIYKGEFEASKVPPEFHAWLHHLRDNFPESDGGDYRYEWQKPHKGNLTGTNLAYFPDGHLLKGGKRGKSTGDYEAWNADTSGF